MKKVKLYGIMMSFSLSLMFASCDQNASQKEIGNSKDTTSVTKRGGPPIRDTATINKDRRDSAKMTAGDSTSKGNADPSGHEQKQPVKQ
jgi:hypothetical protein